MNINIWLPLLCIVALAMFNVPIWLALLGGALPYFLILQPTLPVQIAVQRVVAVTETSSYLAIPFFITAGAIMNYAGISSRLLDLADGLVGHLTGGLGHVNILLSVLMGGVSGSAAADASMEAKILVPEMLKRGYDEEFSAAITIASSLITPFSKASISQRVRLDVISSSFHAVSLSAVCFQRAWLLPRCSTSSLTVFN